MDLANQVLVSQDFMSNEFNMKGYMHIAGLVDQSVVQQIVEEAKAIFTKQMKYLGIVESHNLDDVTFNSGLFRLFEENRAVFINCGKHIQHLVSLHKLGTSDILIDVLKNNGLAKPNICTRPVLYFNKPGRT